MKSLSHFLKFRPLRNREVCSVQYHVNKNYLLLMFNFFLSFIPGKRLLLPWIAVGFEVMELTDFFNIAISFFPRSVRNSIYKCAHKTKFWKEVIIILKTFVKFGFQDTYGIKLCRQLFLRNTKGRAHSCMQTLFLAFWSVLKMYTKHF
jgi:hypothetical protein